MRGCLAFVMVVFCFVSILSQTSWGDEQAPEGILDPLCSPCKTLCEKTIAKIWVLSHEAKECFAFSTLFSTICDLESGGEPAGVVLCSGGGSVIQDLCVYKYGTPQTIKDHAHDVAKEVCKKVKLCK